MDAACRQEQKDSVRARVGSSGCCRLHPAGWRLSQAVLRSRHMPLSRKSSSPTGERLLYVSSGPARSLDCRQLQSTLLLTRTLSTFTYVWEIGTMLHQMPILCLIRNAYIAVQCCVSTSVEYADCDVMIVQNTLGPTIDAQHLFTFTAG